MGLGDGPSWWGGYDWLTADDLAHAAAEPVEPLLAGAVPAVGDLAQALLEQVDEAGVWHGRGPRLLLVDLDNLRAGPTRWAARMAVVVALARQSDHAVMAGQVGAVARAWPHLAEFADAALAVPDGSDVADHALLDGARAWALTRGAPPSPEPAGAVPGAARGADADEVEQDADARRAGPPPPGGQVVVASNDGIFATLAEQGWSLTVLSPGSHALSDRLGSAARRTVDLVDAERAATRRVRSRALRATAARRAPRRSGGRARAGSRSRR